MNIVDLILYQCRQRPPAPALCAPGSGFGLVSYARLERFVHNISRRAHALGLARGDIVAILISDPILHVAFILGLSRIGVVTVSVRSPDLPKELHVAALISEAAVRFSNAGRAIIIDMAWTEGDGHALDDLQIGAGHDEELHRISLTSGTTGESKAVGFSQQMILARVYHYFWVLGVSMSDCARIFVDPGLATAFGYFAVMYILARGGMVMFRGSEPIETMQAFGLYKVQGIIAAPAAAAEFADYYEKVPAFASGLQSIYLGGSLMSQALSNRIRSELCSNLNCGYGSTEAGIVAVCPVKVATSIAGAVGYVAPGFVVEAVDGAGRPLPAGEVGRIRIGGPLCVDRYLGAPESSATSFKDGYFFPGDVGTVTADRLLVLVGREAAILNVGGDKINPERVEHALMDYPAVAQVAVAGMADNDGIERIWAAVVWRGQADEPGLREHCRTQLPAEFVPARLVTVASIPRNETGKIERDQLVKLLTAT
ncbi:MAG TPA: class I adenylate-forming enzyme family protein [Pseudolabrys sp.]|nr:class I adenylate-forming enzyme family protein [Pseudolabrys sp.]